MGAAVDALLLRAPDIGAPGNGVIAELLGEVTHPLELVLCFAQRAVANRSLRASSRNRIRHIGETIYINGIVRAAPHRNARPHNQPSWKLSRSQ
jgi:hypothetical protein